MFLKLFEVVPSSCVAIQVLFPDISKSVCCLLPFRYVSLYFYFAQRTDDKTENLFTVPVAMLFYRSVYRVFILNYLSYSVF